MTVLRRVLSNGLAAVLLTLCLAACTASTVPPTPRPGTLPTESVAVAPTAPVASVGGLHLPSNAALRQKIVGTAAQSLGISPDNLLREWPGRSLAEVARAHHREPAAVAAALKADLYTLLDERARNRGQSPDQQAAFQQQLDARIDQLMTELAPPALGSPESPASPLPGMAPTCAHSSVGLIPLVDLGSRTYAGYPGGLYPGGTNQPPSAYRQAGLARAHAVQPLSSEGARDPLGKIVLLAVGMSNAAQEFHAFQRVADADPRKRSAVVLVNGAQGGADAEAIAQPSAPYWAAVDQRLNAAGVTPAQVQVIWLKEAIAGEHRPFPADAQRLQADLEAIVSIAQQRYPNLQLVYVSSRTYAGYANSPLNPEPYAYDSGFGVRWLVEQHLEHPSAGAWVGWGPYLWTDGTTGRSDGLTWMCGDVAADGTHPSPAGMAKVAQLLLTFFTTDETAQPWFVARP
jgi:hypothetical protein